MRASRSPRLAYGCRAARLTSQFCRWLPYVSRRPVTGACTAMVARSSSQSRWPSGWPSRNAVNVPVGHLHCCGLKLCLQEPDLHLGHVLAPRAGMTSAGASVLVPHHVPAGRALAQVVADDDLVQAVVLLVRIPAHGQLVRAGLQAEDHR